MDFKDLRSMNVARCTEVFHALENWTPTDWSNAMAGEVGETCNLTKKMLRGEVITKRELADEIADVVIYADLLSARCNISLEDAIRNKFNEVSAKKDSRYTL